ncbi:hypothetical protein K661_03308, partial [Piscirickettsia salmonis LF-89 = ATCC VR-1361]
MSKPGDFSVFPVQRTYVRQHIENQFLRKRIYFFRNITI